MKNLDLSVFPSVTKDHWYKLAESQLKGEDPNEALRWKNIGGIVVDPYYDASDLRGLAYLTDFFSQVPSHRWKLYERIPVAEAAAANRAAIAALMGGCDGVIFLCNQAIDERALLKDIDLSICDISFVGNLSLSEKLQKTTGFHAVSNKRDCLMTTENDDPIAQIHEIIERLGEHSFVSRQSFVDFFLEIAAIRAIRYLTRSRKGLHIHTYIARHASEEKQWFLNTTGGLATILGGAHSVDFTTAAGDVRISRNTGNLIREESGIETYTDPCGGAYYVEFLTDQLIKRVEEKR